MLQENREEGEVWSDDSDVAKKYGEDDDGVAFDKLELLGESQELKMLLGNHHLRNLINHIDGADNKELVMGKAMQEPLFLEFANECLKVVEEKNTITLH
ncbi:zinc finger HIT domain-containing protein 3-like [Saccoglossus kowalevskii]|uniref:Zinc finger HIT domain-containing protein 3-like n=1 Tax=Saccoglossus kowalevskii TaxID=10224 RepID=A0ABM0MVM5_SACKO|nr:PREDICTED: zinc finger HIT domain-containing protein 3-like [Saccoglossus kowalevskii]